MADRNFCDGPKALDIGLVTLFCQITVGATGAVTSFTGAGHGIKSVTRNSAGQYTIALDDSWPRLKWCDVQILDSTASNPQSVATLARLFSQAVSSSTAPAVVIAGYNVATGAAADFNNGAVVMVKLEFQNSTVT